MRHEKLVRDFVPDAISKNGERAAIRILDDEEFGLELVRKLREEVEEFCESQAVEELADIVEVVYALARREGVESAALEELRQKKRRDRGGFERRVFLVETQPG